MSPVKPGTQTVPGASMCHEVRGSGLLLLMLPGAPADAGGFAAFAGQLADRYTGVTHDTRSTCRSSLRT